MSKDVFSYDSRINTRGQIASADFAKVSVGKSAGLANALVQNCDVSYGQQIEEVTQVGSTQIFWLPGSPRGQITVSTLVGADGFFSDWSAPCGKIDTASIKVTGGECEFEGSGSLYFSGAIVESLNVGIATGRKTISQGATVRVASMRTS